MKRLAPAALIVAVAIIGTAGAQNIYFEPPNPTSRTPVKALILTSGGLGCPPIDPRVTLEGHRITVTVRRIGSICFATGGYFPQLVYIGMLAPGEYDVVVRTDTYEDPSAKLRVMNGDFIVEPREAVVNGGTKITFGFEEERTFCSDEEYNRAGCNVVLVKVDNRPAEFLSAYGGSVDFRAPARGPGLADVSVAGDVTVWQARAALRYYDRSAPPTPDIYERILFPTLFSGDGFNGSRWTTEATIVNTTDEFVTIGCRDCPGAIAPKFTLRLDKIVGQHRNGYFVWVPYGSVGQIRASETIRQEAGAKPSAISLPAIAVSDMPRRKTLVLDGIPFDDSHRIQLRIYSFNKFWYGSANFVAMSVASFVNPAATPYRETTVYVAPQGIDEPLYGEVFVKQPEGKGTLRIEIRANNLFPFWAFASVTDNVTHEASVILPR